MADRNQNRSYPASGAYAQDARMQGEGDPLAELARLIGQTAPFAPTSRPAASKQRHAEPAPAYHDEVEENPGPAPSPPSWMQRVAAQRAQQEVEPDYVQPQPEPEFDFQSSYQQAQQPDAQAYAASGYAPQAYDQQAYNQQSYDQQAYAPEAYPPQAPQAHASYDAYGHPQQGHDTQDQLDPNRYDDALYGRVDDAHQQHPQDQYQDDPYAYQHAGYAEEEPAPKRRGGMMTVAAVIALAFSKWKFGRSAARGRR